MTTAQRYTSEKKYTLCIRSYEQPTEPTKGKGRTCKHAAKVIRTGFWLPLQALIPAKDLEAKHSTSTCQPPKNLAGILINKSPLGSRNLSRTSHKLAQELREMEGFSANIC